MYISQETANRIKEFAKTKKISVSQMLIDCELNKNALYMMQARGSWLQANNLAKIADYLDCSVDYLLGRTDNPNVNRTIPFIIETENTLRFVAESPAPPSSTINPDDEEN